MSKITRRNFLKLLGLGALIPAIPVLPEPPVPVTPDKVEPSHGLPSGTVTVYPEDGANWRFAVGSKWGDD